MALVINSNIASLQAQKNLSNTQANQATTFQRLSTGLRINSAKDDAGGLFLAEAQTKDIRGLNMATRNAGDGISMAQTAEGALDQIGKNLQRVNELAIQSANGTYSKQARGGLQKEVDQLTQEINRIVETTEFNGNKLLSKDANSETLQIGFENSQGSRITTGLAGGLENVKGMQNKSFAGGKTSYQNITTDTTAGVTTTTNAVVQTDWAKGLGMEGTSLGATPPVMTDAKLGEKLATSLGNALKDYQGDAASLEDAFKADNANTGATEAKFNANGVDFTATFTSAGVLNSLKGNDAGTEFFVKTTGIAALNFKDAATTGITTLKGTDVGNIAAGTGAVDIKVKVSDSNALNAVISDGLTQTKSVDISTQLGAQTAITQTRNAIDMVSEIRAEFGANQNRFEAVISGNQTYTENLSAARSRIQDADFAVETANLAKLQILQQAGTSILGQANASGQSVLGLL